MMHQAQAPPRAPMPASDVSRGTEHVPRPTFVPTSEWFVERVALYDPKRAADWIFGRLLVSGLPGVLERSGDCTVVLRLASKSAVHVVTRCAFDVLRVAVVRDGEGQELKFDMTRASDTLEQALEKCVEIIRAAAARP